MVVVDVAQSYYSSRSANIKIIFEFPKCYTDAKVFKIEMNYRSVPEILEVANAAIAANVDHFQKNLQPTRESAAAKPAVVARNDGSEQDQYIARTNIQVGDDSDMYNAIAVSG